MKIPTIVQILIFFIILTSSAIPCTDFKIKSKDGTILITRSLEFAENLHSNLRSSNQDRDFQMVTNEGQPAMHWKAKYGYVFLDGLDQDIAVDGMNEAGLSFEALYLPGFAQYQA